MKRTLACMLLWTAISGAPATTWAQRAPAANILPENTVLFVSIPSPPQALQRLQQSAIGAISRDPQLQGLVTHLYGSLAAVAQERIGLSTAELLDLAQGEVALALLPVPGKSPALVLLLEAGAQIESARKLVDRLGQALQDSGMTATRSTVDGIPWIVWESDGPPQRHMACLEKDQNILLGTNPDVLRELLTHWNGRSGGSLADIHGYVTLQPRQGDEPPQALFYVDPVGVFQAVGEAQSSARIVLALLPVLGLDGIEGLGATATLDSPLYDFLIRANLLLSTQRGGALKVLGFSRFDPRPEPWVPGDVADYITLRWEFQRSYEALVKLVDSFRGEGYLANWIRQRLGKTGVDWEKDLLPLLEGRVSMVTRLQEPLGPRSRARLVGLRIKDVKAAQNLLARVADEQRPFLLAHEYAGQKFWRVTPPTLSDQPPDESRPALCFGLADDYLLLADRVEVYEKALATRLDGAQSLAESLEFKLVASRARREAQGAEMVLLNFNRPEEMMRYLYSLAADEKVRQRLQRSGERNVLLGSMSGALEANPLPPFSVVQQYLAPGGAVLVEDDAGLHYTAFGLRRTPR